MDPVTKEKLAINASNAWKMWSNWIMAGAGIAFGIYLQLPPEQAQAILAHLPVPPWLIPIIASVVGIAARLWPQHSISPAVAAAKSEDAPQPPVEGVKHVDNGLDLELPTAPAKLDDK